MTDRLRVINLGLPRSGTTTVARALRRASLHAADFRIRAGQSKEDHLLGEYIAALLYEAYFQTGDPLAYLDEFDGFSEISMLRAGQSLWPQMDFGIIEAIRAHHPGVKFFASWRPAADISASMERWSNLATERLPRYNQPGLPDGYGGTDPQRQRWINAHYDHLDRIFSGSDCYMRLDVRADDAAEQLSAYLGRPVPWWGHLNRSPIKATPHSPTDHSEPDHTEPEGTVDDTANPTPPKAPSSKGNTNKTKAI